MRQRLGLCQRARSVPHQRRRQRHFVSGFWIRRGLLASQLRETVCKFWEWVHYFTAAKSGKSNAQLGEIEPVFRDPPIRAPQETAICLRTPTDPIRSRRRSKIVCWSQPRTNKKKTAGSSRSRDYTLIEPSRTIGVSSEVTRPEFVGEQRG